MKYLNLFLALVATVLATPPSYNSAFSVANSYPDCPNTAGPFGSTSYNNLRTNINNCVSDDAVVGCLRDKYNFYNPSNAQVMTQFSYGDTSRINDQMICEYYGIMMDCIATSGLAACDSAVKACFAEDCQDSSRQCYDNTLDSADPAQNKGCAVPTSGAFVDGIPAYTWRTMRDDVDAQTCLCDNGRGYLDTDSYYAWRSSSAASGPHTVLQSGVFCRLHDTELNIGFGSIVTADVADEHGQLVCDLSDALVSCAKSMYADGGSSVDADATDACYGGRDYSNSIGVATGTNCYAACDPINSATLLASVLFALL